jgi:hypothetical protein
MAKSIDFSRDTFIKAFDMICKLLEDVAVNEKRIPDNLDMIGVASDVFDEYNIEMGFYEHRIVLDTEIDTELFINRRHFGMNDEKIEVHVFYDGVKIGQWELDFSPDGRFYRCGGIHVSSYTLAREAASKKRLN